MDIDFSKLDSLTQNSYDSSIIHQTTDFTRDLQNQANLVNKKDQWYRSKIEEITESRSKAKSIVTEVFRKLIADDNEVDILELFTDLFLGILSLTNDASYCSRITDEFLEFGLNPKKSTANLIAYFLINKRFKKLIEARNENINEDIGIQMRRENAIRIHKEFLEKLKGMKEGIDNADC